MSKIMRVRTANSKSVSNQAVHPHSPEYQPFGRIYVPKNFSTQQRRPHVAPRSVSEK